MKTNKITFDKTATMFGIMIVVFAFFAILTSGKTLNASNINNLIMQNGYIIILSVGMLFCTLTGNVDLGVGSVVAAVGAVAATLIADFHVNYLIAMLVSLIVGAGFGLFNGLIISKLKISPFIVTLATMLIARGVCYVVLDSQTKGPLPEEFTFISSGFLPNIMVGNIDLVCIIVGIICIALVFVFDIKGYLLKTKFHQKTLPLSILIAKDVFVSLIIGFVAYKLGVYSGIPVVLIILMVVISLYDFIASKTVIGRSVYALGGNERAAKLSGIDTSKIMFFVYLNMGILCGIVGILLAGRNGSATPKAGESFELDAITACYLGGVATAGGKGKVSNAVIGALIIGILNNGMSLCGLDSNVQKIIKGLVLVAAVAIDVLSKKNILETLKMKFLKKKQ